MDGAGVIFRPNGESIDRSISNHNTGQWLQEDKLVIAVNENRDMIGE